MGTREERRPSRSPRRIPRRRRRSREVGQRVAQRRSFWTDSREGTDGRRDGELMGEEQQQSRRSNSRAATSLAGGFLRDSQAEGCRKRTTEERQGPEAAVKSHFFSKRRTVESIQIEPLISFFYTHPPAYQGARLDLTEETGVIGWKRRTEKVYSHEFILL